MTEIQVNKDFRNQRNNYFSGRLYYINQAEAFFEKQPHSLKKIFSCMLYKSNKELICRVAMETLANFAGIKKNQARRMIKRLKENNFIQVIKGGRSAEFNTEDKTKNRAQTFEISSIFRDKILANKLRHMPGFFKDIYATQDLQSEKKPISISAVNRDDKVEDALYYTKVYKKNVLKVSSESETFTSGIIPQNRDVIPPWWFSSFEAPPEAKKNKNSINLEEIYSLFPVTHEEALA